MIYTHHFFNKINFELMKTLPHRHILNIAKDYKLLKMAQKDDLVLLFNWSNHSRKIQKELSEKGVHLFPRADVSLLIADKIKQLKALEDITRYPLQRKYIEVTNPVQVVAPKLSNDSKTVLKIGNEHQGLNKRLVHSGESILLSENSIFEEYVSESRSIRILGVTRNIEDIFIVEHVNSEVAKLNKETAWIKNIDPIENVYSYQERYLLNMPNIDDIIHDASQIMNFFQHDFMGLDYVISEQKTGFLEANDMIGIPDHDELIEKAKQFFKELCLNHYHIEP